MAKTLNVYTITLVGRVGTAEILGTDEEDARKRYKKFGYEYKIKTITFDRAFKRKKKGD